MTHDLFLALIGFAFVTSATPGPNNMMLLAAGVNFGLRRTVPQIFGIAVGHSLMVFLVGMGVAGVFTKWPAAVIVLKVVSVAYMLWLAAKIARAAAPGQGRAVVQPMTFLQAAAFQWVNPKAWAMALGAVTAYVSAPSIAAYALVALVFSAVNLPSVTAWAAMGQGLRGWLSHPARLRAFNWTMAALLVASLWPVVTMRV